MGSHMEPMLDDRDIKMWYSCYRSKRENLKRKPSLFTTLSFQEINRFWQCMCAHDYTRGRNWMRNEYQKFRTRVQQFVS